MKKILPFFCFCFCFAILATIAVLCVGCGTLNEVPNGTTAEKPPESAIIYFDDENLRITDGTNILKNGDAVAVGKSVSVSYDNTENAAQTVVVYLNGEEWFVVEPNQLEGSILNAEAGKIYGITTERNSAGSATAAKAILSFAEGITVKDANGKTVKASGAEVEAGEYTATFSGGASGVYLAANGHMKASAVNGTSSYRFTISGTPVSLTLTNGASLPLTNTMSDYFITDLNYASDVSVIYDNGKYYLAHGNNWGENKTNIWQIRKADNLTSFTHAGSKAYTAMTLPDFASQVGTAYDADGNWAPELQKIGDYYYMVTTYVCTNHGAENNQSSSNRPAGYKNTSHRTLAILRSRSLTEGWEIWYDHLDTPVTNGKTWDVIDGIIYIQDGAPYLVASHEWTSQPSTRGGSFFCVKLKKDLSGVANGAEWHEMFYVRDAFPKGTSGVTDAPYLYRSSKGELFMLWSSNTDGGYANGGGYSVIMSKSSNGKLDGEWNMVGYLYNRTISGLNINGLTGGHPGLVTTAEGQMYLTLHLYHHEYQETGEPKRPAFIAVRENPETGLLEWGKNDDFIELSAEGFRSQTFVKALNADRFEASFTVRKARLSGTYVGFVLALNDGSEAKLLIDPANGTFATQGANKDTLTKKQSIVLDASDFVKLSVTFSSEEGVKVYVNDVYSEEMTRDLRYNVGADAKLKELSVCSLEGSRQQSERFISWSFTM